VGITNAIVSLRGLIIMANPNFNKDIGCRRLRVWSVIMVTISLLSPMALLGLTSAMIRFLAAGKDKKNDKQYLYGIGIKDVVEI